MSTVPEVVDYFGILQHLYVFFSESPRRREVLSIRGNLGFYLKSFSVTRWSAHHEVIWAVKNGHRDILQTLKHKFEDTKEKPECKRVAKNLYHKLVKSEYVVLTVVWKEVMEHFIKIKNDIARKLSYDKTIREYVATKITQMCEQFSTRSSEHFCSFCDSQDLIYFQLEKRPRYELIQTLEDLLAINIVYHIAPSRP
ncbi:Hypothetical predicted protein [Octopus vulgaris]|uniref:Uncharacterized protein n=1 Tax=Octopus vulgaris TaxID=6645 RepID=A0AA36EZ68_OCTVU|nr:Hypothetical predicted protein [Octopus vulgaris]